jgi:sterol desaturase/sphingolipid hydroxylase (fatty acid hydroxylase superfamily)
VPRSPGQDVGPVKKSSLRERHARWYALGQRVARGQYTEMNQENVSQLLDAFIYATYVISISAIMLEFVSLRLLGEPINRRESVTSLLSGGLAFGGLALANRIFFVGLMNIAWSYRIIDVNINIGMWVAAFIIYDLMFYMAHRAGHRVRLLWCFHSVHHTSEEMRLTTAVRGSMFDFVYLPWFFVWIPILGIHPSVLLIVEVFGRIWGVLTHVHPRFVGRLGIIDRVFVTPSVHRVHHGRNELYLDRNYGEVLLVWDYVFNSHQREVEPPDYGVLARVDSGSLRDVQFSPWTALVRDIRRTRGLSNRLRIALGPPGAHHRPPHG